MPDLKQMLTQVQQMQEQLQQRLERLTVEASAGGGMVSVKMNGQKQLLEVRIEPAVLESADREMLQDLVLAAVNDAFAKTQELAAKKMAVVTGGMNIPGLG